MKFNQQLKKEIESFKDYTILVEGEKDRDALHFFGFGKVYTIHKTAVPLRERIEQIVSKINKKEKICILTDLDRRGKKLYETIKPILQELGCHIDSTLRGILIKANISHIEGIHNFMTKVENLENTRLQRHMMYRHPFREKRFN